MERMSASGDEDVINLVANWLTSYIDKNRSVCNDGSPGLYYYAPAIDPVFTDVFLVYLPGGGQCYDSSSCKERWKSKRYHMSSTEAPKSISKTGLLDSSPSKSVLWGANKASLLYCSSDGYMGNAEASDATWGWHFRGQNLVFAMVDDLIKRHNMTNSSTIILAGGSAVGDNSDY